MNYTITVPLEWRQSFLRTSASQGGDLRWRDRDCNVRLRTRFADKPWGKRVNVQVSHLRSKSESGKYVYGVEFILEEPKGEQSAHIERERIKARTPWHRELCDFIIFLPFHDNLWIKYWIVECEEPAEGLS